MNISERFRDLCREVTEFQHKNNDQSGGSLALVGQAVVGLTEMAERVGDVPRIRLEAELTPVLLKVHNQLDRARLLCEEQGEEDRAAVIWELEQKIYRLLNEL